MNKIRNTLLAGLLLFTALSLNAQNVDEYFDDDGISTSVFRIKTDLISLPAGHIPVTFEALLSDHFSIELGAGLLLPKKIIDLNHTLWDDPLPETVCYSLNAAINWSAWDLRDGAFAGTGISMRNRYLDDYTINEFTYNLFSSYNPYDRFIAEFRLGTGFAFISTPQNSMDDIHLVFRASIIVGYIL